MKKHLLIPQISEDITYHQFSSDSYFVHQKEYNHRIKISNELYQLLQKIDGRKNLHDLAIEVGDGCDTEFIYAILYENLGKYGIIKRSDIKVHHKKKPSYLKLSFIVIPPKIISKITPYLKFLFQPKVMVSLLIMSLVVIIFGIIDKYQMIMTMDMETSWLPLLILGFLSVTLHEFGHVTATDYFGATHGGIGGGFYLFSPVYFADVTDIWKLRPRQRIIVNMAGIYFELLICSLYVIIGLIFKSNILYLVGLLIFLKTLFNLNPFLRSDGYWVLTDAVGIPNLYRNSSSKLRELSKAIFLKNKIVITLRDILLAIYALINYLLLVAFLYYVVILDSHSFIFFPINLLSYILGLLEGTNELNLESLSQFALPLLFYSLIIKICINKLKEYFKKYGNTLRG
ncbi:hypothetical protein RM553_03855 [Zunongwangia sp. F363]|uniref:Peptide zinc metalloprotease protein n=1 Tax=Autumnicola tepida TaxID=3075595 RepID=A0ABU3C6J8_9FLAO|nr:hypothetical protein [Zunongwangia sp. F363]MDT0641959.1 hypothetical protein [Zunongwangia sp. F363]